MIHPIHKEDDVRSDFNACHFRAQDRHKEGDLHNNGLGTYFGYKLAGYTIATAKITSGKAQDTGGDIVITFNN